MKHLLGLGMVKRGSFLGTWLTILQNIGATNVVTFV
eukprot:SAG31_NODE_26879_length_435_cov_0.595238_2_plen_35_part_01